MLTGAFRTKVTEAVATYRTLFSMTSRCCMGARFGPWDSTAFKVTVTGTFCCIVPDFTDCSVFK